MGAYLDLIQSAIVGSLDVIAALGNGAGNTVVGGLVFHSSISCV